MNKNQNVSMLLEKIRAEMLVQSLWQKQPIEAAAMQSTLPFCTDTMSFEQWLQFVLVARLEQMLAAGQPLPNSSAVAPMAEEYFKDRAELFVLVQLLGELDTALSAQ